MKIRIAALLILTLIATIAAKATTKYARHDTVQVYQSWQAMFAHQPDTVLIDPKIKVNSPFDFKITPKDKPARNILKEQAVAVTLGDTLWLISSDWIKRNFKGDCGSFSRYLPLYFSSKIAFVQFRRNNPTVGGAMLNTLLTGLTGMDMGVGMGDGYNGRPPKFYLLDFAEGRVREVDYELLLQLMQPYPSMKRGYEWRRDAEETYMVNDYFLLYVERLSQDPTIPDLF